VKYTELTADNLAAVDQLKDELSFYLEMPDANYHTSPFAGFVIGDGTTWLVSRDAELLKAGPAQKAVGVISGREERL
jgi:hypothetical protein